MSDEPEAKREWASATRAWWRALQPYDDERKPNPTGGDRGALARLRRASSPADALVEPAVLDLYRKLGCRNLSGEWLALTAAAAMTLAHVREDEKVENGRRKHPAASVGRTTFDDKKFESAKMKPMRFQRLLLARATDEIVREMRRLVQLAEHQINVGRLAADILTWRDDEAGDRMRTHWAYEYLAAGRDAPDANPPPPAIPQRPQ